MRPSKTCPKQRPRLAGILSSNEKKSHKPEIMKVVKICEIDFVGFSLGRHNIYLALDSKVA